MLLATDTGYTTSYFLLVLTSPLATIVLLLVASWIEKNKWTRWAIGLLAGATAFYAFGLLCMFRLETAYHNCLSERYGEYIETSPPVFVESTDKMFPVSSLCSWEDGVTIDIVPWYVNPAIMVFLVAAIACGAVAVSHKKRIRSGRHIQTDEGKSA